MQKQVSSKIIKVLKKFFSDNKNKEVLFCYLFGSQVTKNSVSESDVDLAIYLDESKSKKFSDNRLELTGEISKLLKKQADIVVLNTAGLFLKYVILKQGKLIFEKNSDKRIDFELKSINEYFDFKPAMEEYNKRLLNI